MNKETEEFKATDFRTGMIVSFTLRGEEGIKRARVLVNVHGKVLFDTGEEMLYIYDNKYDSTMPSFITDLVVLPRTIEDGLVVGDELDDGDYYIGGVTDNIIFLIDSNGDIAGSYYTIDELNGSYELTSQWGYTDPEETSEIPQYSVAELIEKLGEGEFLIKE